MNQNYVHFPYYKTLCIYFFLGFRLTRNAYEPNFESHKCIRNKTIGLLYNQSDTYENRQIYLKSSLSEGVSKFLNFERTSKKGGMLLTLAVPKT